MSDVDIKALLEQEPEFKQYMAESMYEALSTDRGFDDIAKAVLSMYQTGLTSKQVGAWIRNMMRLG